MLCLLDDLTEKMYAYIYVEFIGLMYRVTHALYYAILHNRSINENRGVS